MNETEFTELLQEAIENTDELSLSQISKFRDYGLMTNNNGFVIQLQDGSEFQITVVQSKLGE